MKRSKRFFVSFGVFVIVIVVFFFITSSITKYTGYSVVPVEEDDFEKCLREQEIVLYINSADSSKTLKDVEVFDYLKYFDIVNCYGDNALCVEEGVEGFTWMINEFRVESDISFSDLIKYSGCRFV